MIVSGVKCTLCGDTIYSRANHDFHYCSCGNLFIDGGQATPGRMGWKYENTLEGCPKIEIDAKDRDALYSDWAHGIDMYGYIFGEDTPQRKRAIAKGKLVK